MLDVIHHVIFIGDWLQEMSARERVFVRLVNKRRSFPIWDSSLAVATLPGGAAGGDICGRAVPGLSARLGLCVWMSVFSPVCRAHKQAMQRAGNYDPFRGVSRGSFS